MRSHRAFRKLSGVLALVALLGGTPVVLGQLAASANFVLQRHAFTAGKPNATNPVASSNFTLQAMSLGGISYTAATTTVQRVHSGYLVPWDLLLSRPDLLTISVHDGRIWLVWAAAGDPVSYTVESALGMTNFQPAATGLSSNRWDAPVPATGLFYRVKARPPP